MKFKHFLITRFNVRTPHLDDYGNPMCLNLKWLTKRIQLFNEYCYPSVYSQSNKKFIWFVLMDKETPEKYITQMKSFEICNILFIDHKTENIFGVLKREINKLANGKRVVTTRLDSDDCLHKCFIGQVQEAIINSSITNDFAVNPSKGICYHPIKSILTLNKDKSSPFITLIEKNENFKTVFYKWHNELASTYPTIQVSDIPLWMQVIHGANLSNILVGRPIHDFSIIEDFSINHENLNYLKFFSGQMGYIFNKIFRIKL